MIVTLTLNPSLDLTYELGEPFGSVEVHRARGGEVEASGKGVNVSRALHAGGVATLAVFPAGGPTGRHLGELLAADGVPNIAVPQSGHTRINTSLLLADGNTVKVNGAGTPLSPTDLASLLATVDEVLAAQAGRAENDGELWLAVCGSLPPGLDPGVVGEIVGRAQRHTARIVVDISGPALGAALRAGADLLAPNRAELAEMVGQDDGDVVGTATRLAREHGVGLLVSMGGDGAVYADAGVAVRGGGPRLSAVNTVGAGDAFLSGWLAGPGSAAERMARALAWGRSACLCPATVDLAPGTRGTEGITVTEILAGEGIHHD